MLVSIFVTTIMSMYKLLFLVLFISQTACSQTSNKANTKNNTMSKNIYYSTTNKEKVVVPDSVWKQILSPEVYAVARQKGTERPFTSPFETSKEINPVLSGPIVRCVSVFFADTKEVSILPVFSRRKPFRSETDQSELSGL